MKRLKVPGPINQFTQAADPNTSKHLFSLLKKYTPETRQQKRERLVAEAQGGNAPQRSSQYLRFGLNNVTNLVENGQAKLVCIANDVDPVELVMWLPQLCQRKNIPFMIVKNKARLGRMCNQKTATCVALVDVRESDQATFNKTTQRALELFNNNSAALNADSDPVLGFKARQRQAKQQRERDAETVNRLG